MPHLAVSVIVIVIVKISVAGYVGETGKDVSRLTAWSRGLWCLSECLDGSIIEGGLSSGVRLTNILHNDLLLPIKRFTRRLLGQPWIRTLLFGNYNFSSHLEFHFGFRNNTAGLLQEICIGRSTLSAPVFTTVWSAGQGIDKTT